MLQSYYHAKTFFKRKTKKLIDIVYLIKVDTYNIAMHAYDLNTL